MSQLLQKTYDCMTCKQQIRISKIDNFQPGQKKKWDKFELDGVTPHVCRKADQQQEQQSQPQLQFDDLSKEIMTIKTQLLAVVNRLGYVEKKLMMR